MKIKQMIDNGFKNAFDSTEDNILIDDLVNYVSQHVENELCAVIGDWYLEWKHKIANYEDKTHNLGFAKERLKEMLCSIEE